MLWIVARTGVQLNHLTFLKLSLKLKLLNMDNKLNINLSDYIIDAIEWKVDYLTSKIANKNDIYALEEVKLKTAETIAIIKNISLKSTFIDFVCKKFRWKVKDFSSTVETITKKSTAKLTVNDDIDSLPDDSEIEKPKWVSSAQWQHYEEFGYVEFKIMKNNKPTYGYFSFSNGNKIMITNFTIEPLFHIYAGKNSRYLSLIDNGYKKKILDIESKIITSIEPLQQVFNGEGNFIIHGNKGIWLKIASNLLQNFPRCIEIKKLGWHRDGFFSYTDKIFHPQTGINVLNEWGIYKTDTENYLIAASCEAYKQLENTGNDPYENLRYLTLNSNPESLKLTLKDWCTKMQLVYGKEKASIGIAFSFLSLFKDLIFEIDNNCPHLYAYGEKSSGKSKWAESITALFYLNRSAFNLNSGTDFAFFNYMSQFINCPAHLNEFDIDVIKQEWFQAIKGIFDGEGRQRGKIANGADAVEIQRVLGTLILTGQYLVTHDDNSVVTRSIIEAFSTNNEEYTEEQRKDYSELKEWESKGLNHILTEILVYRDKFKNEYRDTFNGLLSHWRRTKHSKVVVNSRIMQNWAHLAASYTLIWQYIYDENKTELPISTIWFGDFCYDKAIYWTRFITSSDTLSEFWKTVEFLVNEKIIELGWDLLLDEPISSVKLRKGNNEDEDVVFKDPIRILYLRINNVHKKYEHNIKTRTSGKAMNMQTLMHYLTSKAYFIGNVKSKRFSRIERSNVQNGEQLNSELKREQIITSCIAFNFNLLNIEINTNYGNETISQKLF
jgi:DNA primase